jgi:hypothetical protein
MDAIAKEVRFTAYTSFITVEDLYSQFENILKNQHHPVTSHQYVVQSIVKTTNPSDDRNVWDSIARASVVGADTNGKPLQKSVSSRYYTTLHDGTRCHGSR